MAVKKMLFFLDEKKSRYKTKPSINEGTLAAGRPVLLSFSQDFSWA